MRVLVEASRLDAVGAAGPVVRPLLDLAPRGLRTAALADGEFAQTVRGVAGTDGVSIHVEGSNIRYAAMAALGLSRLGEDGQREVLHGSTARELALRTAELAATQLGPRCRRAVRLGIGGGAASATTRRCSTASGSCSRPTSHCRPWTWPGCVTAAVAAAPFEDTAAVVDAAVGAAPRGPGHRGDLPPRTARHQGAVVARPRRLVRRPGLPGAGARARPDALVRDAATGSTAPTARPHASASCRVPHGQWWWHYDVRDGSVVERYPVYSVHQHAMAPMALLRPARGRRRRPHAPRSASA